MKSEVRQVSLYELIKSRGSVSVSVLSEYFAVSPMTIRRDLDALAHSGLIKRQYGKASIMDDSKQEMSFTTRSLANHSLKHQIAVTAIQCLKDISSVYIDGSSTAHEFICSFPTNRHLTVFTNSIAVLEYLRNYPNISTFIIGGFLAKDNNTLDSELSINVAKNIFVDATIISCSGFSTLGVFNNGITGSQVKRIMLENSGRNFLLADHTKFNSQGIFLLNAWDKIDTFICDCPFDAKAAREIEKHGVKIITSTP